MQAIHAKLLLALQTIDPNELQILVKTISTLAKTGFYLVGY